MQLTLKKSSDSMIVYYIKYDLEVIKMKKLVSYLVTLLSVVSILLISFCCISCGAKLPYDDTIGIFENDNNTDTLNENESTTEYTEEETFEGYYEYPTKDYMSGQDIERVCRIQQEILDIMSLDQIAQAVVDYPLLVAATFSSSSQSYSTTFARCCDAYRELITRAGAKSALQEKLSQLKETEDENINAKLELLEEIINSEKSFERPTRPTLDFSLPK